MLKNIYIHNKCPLGTAASAGSSASISRRLVGRHPDEHKLILHNILNCTCRSVFFFQLPDGARVGSIPRHIQTDFVSLATLFSPYFKQLLKLQPVRINVATLSPKKKQFPVTFRRFSVKSPLFYPLVLLDKVLKK
jgi:hypothetical protein